MVKRESRRVMNVEDKEEIFVWMLEQKHIFWFNGNGIGFG